MKILFVHQNFPGQFRHLAPALVQRGHSVIALTAEQNSRQTALRTYRYPMPDPAPDPRHSRMGTTYTAMTDRAHRAARAAVQLRDNIGFSPDVVFGHGGWGETLFLREIWPDARHLTYAEFYYASKGLDVGFDPEFSRNDISGQFSVVARQAHLALSMVQADAAVSPTEWQADSFPAPFRDKITITHDGIDTDYLTPDPLARYQVPGGPLLYAGDEVLTFVARNLEPYRGAHIFLRCLPDVLAARPGVHVVIVGGDGASYGAPPRHGSWKDQFLREVQGRLDMSRVHFTGRVPYGDFMSIMRISRVHAYLTVPFVLSWSLLEAMSMGACIVASRTGPVEEVITDTENGRLVDFFDVDRWSEMLVDALEAPHRYDRMRDAARRTIVENYDLKRVCLPRLIRFVEEG
ncbi:MAG: glycosyltransferase [Rhodobacteraceae bacterium]|nr:glycosyltransferase [Paracoccaceae bacterium]